MLNKLIEKYEERFLRNDFIILIMLYIVGLCFLYFKKISFFSFIKNIDNFYSSLLTISSGLFLFLITSVTILISFLETEELSLLNDTKHPSNMLKTFFSGIRLAGLEIIFSIATSFSIPYEKYFFYIVFFFFLFMIIRVIRIVWILYNLSLILILRRK